jgi:pentapeptide repeat protein
VSDAASGKGRKAEMTDSKPPSDSEERRDEKWYDRTRYQVLLFVGGIVLFVLAGGWILDWYIEPHTSGQKKDLVQALGLLTAGVAGAVGIFFTWRGQRITQESLQDTRENSEENLRLARGGQITERFTRAIDQLGATNDNSKNLELRLGGIYALERIARESEEDHWPIMEVLTAYVRQHASWRPEEAQQVRDRPAADIRAIMTVLGRRTRSLGHREPARLDLHATTLTRAALFKAYLSRADLWGANLRGVNLVGADLTQEQMEKATGGENTRLPSDLKPPAHWGVKTDEHSEGD